MENCLVKTLKGTVNNTNLDYFGMFKIHFDAGTTVVSDTDYTQIMLVFSEDTTIVLKNVTGGCHFTNIAGTANYGTERTITGDGTTQKPALVSKGTCDLLIPKKNLIEIAITSTNKGVDRFVSNINGLSHYPNIKNLTCGNGLNKAVKELTGDIGSISGNAVTKITIPQTAVVGDVTGVMSANHNTLTEVNLAATDIRLDMSVLDQYSFPNITKFILPNDIVNGDIAYLGNLNCDISFREKAVTDKLFGTIESYAAKRASVFGAGSCTVSYAHDFDNVTYNGTALSNLFAVRESPTLTWDASGNITSFE